MAINKAKLYKDLNDLFLSTIKAIANAIEAKDPYTRGHSDRIRTFSLLIAKELGLQEQEIKDLEIAALLHDVGKIGVPEALLRKRSALTPEENEEMMKHPVIGADILFSIKQLQSAIPGIRHHQERYDGKGYPDGLSGEDIPLLARIIAVADTFDAMTSDRPYRKALQDQEALKELEHCSGVQFDEKCVRAFIIGYAKSRQKNRNTETGKI
jgi:HD-GYP domain-containing protein (c-di-GMP phosphodiesterase class II)